MNPLKNILLICGLAISFIACKKAPPAQPLNGQGNTIVKFVLGDNPPGVNPNGLPDTANGKEAGYALFNIELVSSPQVVEVVDIRRDVPNNEELNKPMHITIMNDPGAVNAYDSRLTPLPDGSFTVDAATPLLGTEYQVDLKPGQFAQTIKIAVTNILAEDLTKNYAVGFTITSADANGKIANLQKTMVVELGLKNKWDGIYTLKGYILRNVPPLDEDATGWVGPKEISLATTGPNSVRYVESHGWANQATIGIAATVSNPTYTFDASNNITITSDGGAYPEGLGNLPGYSSRYDPDNKTIYAYATWSGGPSSRAMMDTLTYLRPR
jgi:hypothetical protein